MSFFWALIASLAVIAITGVSAVANWVFGWSQGTVEPFTFLFWQMNSAELFAGASLALDVLKCLMLFGVSIGLASRSMSGWMAGAVCLVIWVVALCVSWTSAVGFVSLNHQRIVDGADKTKDAWGDAKLQMQHLQKQRGLIPDHRGSDIVKVAIDSKRAEQAFDATDNCRDPRGARAVKFCQEYRGLLAEEVSAASAEKLDTEIRALRVERDGRTAISIVDPLAASLAALTSTSEGTVSKYRSWFFASILEFISALGLWAIWTSRGDAKILNRKPRPVISVMEATPPVVQPVAVATTEKQEEPKRKWDANAYLKQFPAKGKSKVSTLQQIVERVVEEVRSEKGVGELISAQEADTRVGAACKAVGVTPPSQEQRGKALAKFNLHSTQHRSYKIGPRPTVRRERGQHIHA